MLTIENVCVCLKIKHVAVGGRGEFVHIKNCQVTTCHTYNTWVIRLLQNQLHAEEEGLYFLIKVLQRKIMISVKVFVQVK